MYHWERACGATKSTLRSYMDPSPDWSGRSNLPRGVVTTKEYSKNYKPIVTTKTIRTIQKKLRSHSPQFHLTGKRETQIDTGFEVTTFSTERRDGPSSPLYTHTANRRMPVVIMSVMTLPIFSMGPTGYAPIQNPSCLGKPEGNRNDKGLGKSVSRTRR